MIKKCLTAGVAGFVTSYMLFKSILLSFAVMLIFVLFSVFDKKSIEKERYYRMQRSFLDFLMCLEPLLKNSGTFFKAFKDASVDYRRFHGKDELGLHLDAAVNDFKMNTSTVGVLDNLAEKLDIEDARAFAGSMSICESTGGNPVEITAGTTELLVEKIRILCDLKVTLSGKVFEQKVITMMPFILLGIFTIVSAAYLEPLYTTTVGRIVMAAAGMMFAVQWFIGKKITDIKV